MAKLQTRTRACYVNGLKGLVLGFGLGVLFGFLLAYGFEVYQ